MSVRVMFALYGESSMKKIAFAIALSSLMLMTGTAYAAGECDTDTDCESYETCELVGEASCACPPGDAGCDCPDTGTQEFKECVPEPPPSCDTDADCSEDLLCVTRTYEECSGGGPVGTCTSSPDGGTICEDVGTADVSESCETITEGYCVPPYLAPCQADADCGDGFTCEEYEVCECTGGGSTGSGGDDDRTDAGEPPEDTGDSCTCEPAGKSCELVETECTSDADCTGDLTCQEYEDGDVVTEPCVDEGDASSCESADTGSSTTTKYCLPPDWERWAGAANDLGGGGSVDEDDRENYGDAGTTGGDIADAGEQGAPSQDDSGSNTEGGCSSSGQHAPVGGLALALLGLLGVAIRRRG